MLVAVEAGVVFYFPSDTALEAQLPDQKLPTDVEARSSRWARSKAIVVMHTMWVVPINRINTQGGLNQ